MNPKQKQDTELIEKLAAIEHERWADWQKWMHKCLNPNPMGEGFPYLLNPEFVERWNRQIETPYAELSEAEKQSDRDQVMRYWPLIEARDAQHEIEVRQDEYLSAEVAWFNYNDDYFNNRASELEAQLSLNKKEED